MPAVQRPTPEERQKAEARARASIEARYGHPLTDAEWDKAKANLRAFFGLLAQWQVNNPADTDEPPSPAPRAKRKRSE